MIDIDFKIGKRNYKLTSDTMNYILKVESSGEKKSLQTLGYYHSPFSVLKNALNNEILGSDCKSFLELENKYIELIDEIRSIIHKFDNLEDYLGRIK